ncbi:MAG: Holliday junction branch migration protein RuvA [Flavobacteriales bacterium]|nr:Holliday junction branch migration protein RuvA [Flavobacteriales bacterium]
MISWIKGELVDLWQTNNKFYILINCQGLGYEIQILESIYIKLKTNEIPHQKIILWLKHIKKEDSDYLFGFISKDQKDFFIEILNIKGIGSQIGMSLLNKFSIDEIINAIDSKDKKLISSVQGIGQKMTERIILELKNKSKMKIKDSEKEKNSNYLNENNELNSILQDIDLTLQSLNYSNKEIKKLLPILVNEIKNKKNEMLENDKISFEYILKLAMNHLDNNSNLGR